MKAWHRRKKLHFLRNLISFLPSFLSFSLSCFLSLFTQGSTSNRLLLLRCCISSSFSPDFQTSKISSPSITAAFTEGSINLGSFFHEQLHKSSPKGFYTPLFPCLVPVANMNLATAPGPGHTWRERLPNSSLRSHLRKLKQPESPA